MTKCCHDDVVTPFCPICGTQVHGRMGSLNGLLDYLRLQAEGYEQQRVQSPTDRQEAHMLRRWADLLEPLVAEKPE